MAVKESKATPIVIEVQDDVVAKVGLLPGWAAIRARVSVVLNNGITIYGLNLIEKRGDSGKYVLQFWKNPVGVVVPQDFLKAITPIVVEAARKGGFIK